MLAKEYLEKASAILKKIEESQLGKIEEAAEIISQAIVDGHMLFAFGCSHSSLPVQDIFYRAGGLMLVNPIFGPGLSLEDFPPTFTSKMERLEGYGRLLLDRLPTKAGDVLLLVSVSGRNAVPVDMAMAAREKGMKVIGLTSMEYTTSVSSRHSSGKRMYELVDVVIDNPVPAGDAILEVEGVPQKICPISGVTSCAILHALIAATVEKLLAKGFTPPIHLAANMPGGDEYNKRLRAEYKDRMLYAF
jgi:uncharacterized phosphosugar-binding protein